MPEYFQNQKTCLLLFICLSAYTFIPQPLECLQNLCCWTSCKGPVIRFLTQHPFLQLSHPPTVSLLSGNLGNLLSQKSFQVDLISFLTFFISQEAGIVLPFTTLQVLSLDPCAIRDDGDKRAVYVMHTSCIYCPLVAIIPNFAGQISPFFEDFSIWLTIYFSTLLSAIYHEDFWNSFLPHPTIAVDSQIQPPFSHFPRANICGYIESNPYGHGLYLHCPVQQLLEPPVAFEHVKQLVQIEVCQKV